MGSVLGHLGISNPPPRSIDRNGDRVLSCEDLDNMDQDHLNFTGEKELGYESLETPSGRHVTIECEKPEFTFPKIKRLYPANPQSTNSTFMSCQDAYWGSEFVIFDKSIKKRYTTWDSRTYHTEYLPLVPILNTLKKQGVPLSDVQFPTEDLHNNFGSLSQDGHVLKYWDFNYVGRTPFDSFILRNELRNSSGQVLFEKDFQEVFFEREDRSTSCGYPDHLEIAYISHEGDMHVRRNQMIGDSQKGTVYFDIVPFFSNIYSVYIDDVFLSEMDSKGQFQEISKGQLLDEGYDVYGQRQYADRGSYPDRGSYHSKVSFVYEFKAVLKPDTTYKVTVQDAHINFRKYSATNGHARLPENCTFDCEIIRLKAPHSIVFKTAPEGQ